MTTLTLMYVYYDVNGDIKSICPHHDTALDNLYNSTTLPLETVGDFLTGKLNTFNYRIKVVKTTLSTDYTIEKKIASVPNLLRRADTYLTQIENIPRNRDASIIIENIVSDKHMKLKINPSVRVLREDGTDEEKDGIEKFIDTPVVSLFFTKKDDPYFLLHTIDFVPAKLFEEGALYIKYPMELKNVSVYTQKLINGYSYSEKGA